MMNLFYRFAKTRIGQLLIRLLFSKMPFAIPVKRLCQTESLLAFHHPRPAHPFHVIIVPRKPVASLDALDPQDTAFLSDLFSTVQGLVQEYKLPAYRLIVNGGEYQEFPHLHFHLVSPSPQPLSLGERGEG
jgi:histidine triad (HIT) family protein